jgi:hypothetical protein
MKEPCSLTPPAEETSQQAAPAEQQLLPSPLQGWWTRTCRGWRHACVMSTSWCGARRSRCWRTSYRRWTFDKMRRMGEKSCLRRTVNLSHNVSAWRADAEVDCHILSAFLLSSVYFHSISLCRGSSGHLLSSAHAVLCAPCVQDLVKWRARCCTTLVSALPDGTVPIIMNSWRSCKHLHKTCSYRTSSNGGARCCTASWRRWWTTRPASDPWPTTCSASRSPPRYGPHSEYFVCV